MEMILPLVAMFAIFYFLLIRPQQKQQQQFRAMIAAVKRGDEVLTSGGIKGKVTRAIDDSEVEVEIAPDIKVRLSRTGIASVLNMKETPAPEKKVNKGNKKKKASKETVKEEIVKDEPPKGEVLEVEASEVIKEETSEK